MVNSRTPCKLPNIEKNERSSCFNNSKSENFKETARTPKDFGSDGERIRGEQNNTENNSQKSDTKARIDQGYSSESSSVEDKEFNHLQDAELDQQTISSKILVAVPNGLGRKKYTTCLGLLDSGASGFLADKNIIFSCPNSKTKRIETTW